MCGASMRPSRRSRPQTCRCSGSACRRSAMPANPPTRPISTSSTAARRDGRHHLCRRLGRLCRRGRPLRLQGPDFEGQIRRLRSGDGIYFTKAGARKLAHYVEREILRSLVARRRRWRCRRRAGGGDAGTAGHASACWAGGPADGLDRRRQRASRRSPDTAVRQRSAGDARAGARRAGHRAGRTRRQFRLAEERRRHHPRRRAGGDTGASTAGDASAAGSTASSAAAAAATAAAPHIDTDAADAATAGATPAADARRAASQGAAATTAAAGRGQAAGAAAQGAAARKQRQCAAPAAEHLALGSVGRSAHRCSRSPNRTTLAL